MATLPNSVSLKTYIVPLVKTRCENMTKHSAFPLYGLMESPGSCLFEMCKHLPSVIV